MLPFIPFSKQAFDTIPYTQRDYIVKYIAAVASCVISAKAHTTDSILRHLLHVYESMTYDTVRAKFWLPESYRDANYKYIFEKFKQKQKETNK